jgi:geranylgeranyl transferase type-1 subunit beta
MSAPKGTFQRERHVKYWLRCAKTFLPAQYTSGDSNRMLLAFFIVAALDLLDILDSKVSEAERKGWVDWVYSCQVPGGGFRGFTGSDLGGLRDTANQHWDPANLPATFFALCTLLILGDDLGGVEREGTLAWMGRLQRTDGSFGETLGEGGRIEGGSDTRFCCCAAGVRHILRGEGTDGEEPFDVEGVVEYIASCQVCGDAAIVTRTLTDRADVRGRNV